MIDKLIRFATSATVLAVAVFAAVTSYSHVYQLGRLHAQDGTAARLLPLSVDGLILAASLVLLHEARHDRAAPALGRCMLWLGIGATIAANALYGATAGPLAAVISTWPAISFIGSVEMAMLLVRRSRTPDTEPTGTARELADAPDTVPVLAPDKAAIPDTAARLRAEGMSYADIVDRLGVSTKTIQRRLKAANGSVS